MSNRGVGNWDIYKMDTDGQNVVRLTDDPAKDDRASWSLDGEGLHSPLLVVVRALVFM